MKLLRWAILGLITSLPAHAQSRDMRTVWMIEGAEAPVGERKLASGEFVLKQRLLPTGLAETALDISAAAIGVSIPAGTQLIQVQTDGAKIFCDSRFAKQKLIGHAQICLVDSDMDDRFDGYFKTTSQTKGLITIAGKRPKVPPALDPVPYRNVNPATMREEYFVGIQRRNFFNIYNRETFTITFGHDDELERLTEPVQFKSSELPKELSILGAHFTAISEENGRMTVKVDSAIPPQPFGIVKTTTYDFY